MTRAKKVMVVLIVATLGIWGCAQGQAPNSSAGLAERIKALEAKNTKLEESFRDASATRDQLRKKLAAVDEETQQLRQDKQSAEQARESADQQAKGLAQERDELKQQLNARTGERDALLVQYDQFRKNIRELLGQAEAGITKPATEHPVTSAATVVTPGKS